MHEKGVIQDVVPWKKSRSYFYWRLRRRLAEKEAISRIIEAHQKLTYSQALTMLRRWYVEDKEATDDYLWEDNRILVDWLENQLRVSFFSFKCFYFFFYFFFSNSIFEELGYYFVH